MDDAQLISEARGWIADCFSDVDAGALSDEVVRWGIRNHYAGGWAQFVADAA
jgi:hypothetical protein